MSVLSVKISRMYDGYYRLTMEYPNQLYVGRKEYLAILEGKSENLKVDFTEEKQEYLGMAVNVLDKDNHIDVGVY